MVNDTIGIRYFQRNVVSDCTVKKQKSVETYTWEFSNIPSLRHEPYSLAVTELLPCVLLAPRWFELKGIRGNTDNWKSLGWWYYELIKDRDDLSAETRQKVTDLIAGVGDTLKKVEILYHYLQEKTRYASIQIGIGGWQPDWASEVDRLGYGDCKALVNYMKSLLAAAGISSYYALVHAGKDEPDIITGFPAHQFNHVILCVPVNNDSLWLECTSQDLPAGYLSTFTDDRSVLLVREAGGFLCRTPVYGQDVNTKNRSGTVILQQGGDARVNVKTSIHGLFYDASRKIMHLDETDKRKELAARISASDFVLESFTLKENKTDLPGIEETLKLTIRNIFTKAGGLMLFVPNQLTREEGLSSQVIKRNSPVEIRRSTFKTDTIFYTLPDGFAFTGNPADVTIASKFGKYRAVTAIKGQTLQYIRNLVIYKGTHPQESYEDFLEFFEKISNADSKKLALKATN
jgi:hypothetical protein